MRGVSCSIICTRQQLLTVHFHGLTVERENTAPLYLIHNIQNIKDVKIKYSDLTPKTVFGPEDPGPRTLGFCPGDEQPT